VLESKVRQHVRIKVWGKSVLEHEHSHSWNSLRYKPCYSPWQVCYVHAISCYKGHGKTHRRCIDPTNLKDSTFEQTSLIQPTVLQCKIKLLRSTTHMLPQCWLHAQRPSSSAPMALYPAKTCCLLHWQTWPDGCLLAVFSAPWLQCTRQPEVGGWQDMGQDVI